LGSREKKGVVAVKSKCPQGREIYQERTEAVTEAESKEIVDAGKITLGEAGEKEQEEFCRNFELDIII
jgi:hypothetical protein